LNRNYPFGFGGPGASADPCHWLYRGPHPFSEPETAAIRNFLLKYDNIKLAINMHAYGNFLCTPFNALGIRNQELNKSRYKQARSFFEQLRQSGTRPKGNEIGNGAQTVDYQAPGTLSDWLLSSMNIITVTPELGTNDPNSDDFFIKSKEVLKDVLDQNFKWMHFSFSWLATEYPSRKFLER